MHTHYVIGLDYGTKSGRAILVETASGTVCGESVREYPHCVMDQALPDTTTKLPPDWALQHPDDYLLVLTETIPEVLAKTGVKKEDVIGLSLDFTASTILPVDVDGKPLCNYPEFANRPHAYVKLWKHHAAKTQTEQINALLRKRGEIDLPRYGGKISSELLLPKCLQILQEDPEVYTRADKIMEAPDWLNFLMTGKDRRSGSTAGYKAMWLPGEGYPDRSFFCSLDPRLENFVEEKLSLDVCPVGEKYGELTPEWADKLGLLPGTAVGASIIDAHAGLPGCGITKPGQMMLIIGTSSVQAVLSERPVAGKGICGSFCGGIMPGYYALESGLAGVGDIFAWFVDSCLCEETRAKAKALGMDAHSYLTKLAKEQKPGQSGLLALDWWNGNKTPFVDADLSGLLLGCTLTTRPEEIYRALIEATAYGTRTIMEEFDRAGVQVDEIYACGGIAEKNEMLLQIYADVTNREIKVAASTQTAALGAAMYAAVAAGKEKGGYDSVEQAARAMSRIKETSFHPILEHVAIYEKLYSEYRKLQSYFGTQNDVMHTLKQLKAQA